MRTLAIALGAILSLTSCTSLSQEDYDRLAAIPGEIKQVYDQARALTDEAKDLVRISNERALTDDERIRIGVLFERVQELIAKGKDLAREYEELRAKAADGSFDWDGLVYLVMSLVGAAGGAGIVRFQRGPAKPVDKDAAKEIRHLDADTLAKLKELARQSGGTA